MCVAHADLVGWALLLDVVRVVVFLALSVRARVVPQDQIQALATRDVVCAVALAAQVADTGTFHMLVGVRVLPVVPRAHQPAELQTRAVEVQAEADVEGHVRVVRVHVEAEILVLAVAHNEAMVPVPHAPGPRPQELAQRLEHALELVDHRLQPDLVEDDAVVVHAVRPPRWQAAVVEVEDFLDEGLTKVFRENLEGEHLPWQVLCQDGPPRLGGARLHGAPEGGVEPLRLPAGRRLEELLVSNELRILPNGAQPALILLPVGGHLLVQPHGRGIFRNTPGLQWVHQESVHRLQHAPDCQRDAVLARQRLVERFKHEMMVVVDEGVVDHTLKAHAVSVGQGERPLAGLETDADTERKGVCLRIFRPRRRSFHLSSLFQCLALFLAQFLDFGLGRLHG
mmetsp:Transcript_72317/g.182379  ORF Transcript_72317/g.182379 Transcript_72317/m.182379 type:complete len:397 (-) Transcript_72317:756-1946(-)